jgi:HPt (histidine-containing phosphotransfer) domain-containing protein
MHIWHCPQPVPEIDSFQFFEWLHKSESGPVLARMLSSCRLRCHARRVFLLAVLNQEGTVQQNEPSSRGHQVDFEELLARVDHDRELLRELVSIFKQDFPQHLRALREAIARRDRKQMAIVSHTLKGMLANLAVTEAAAAAARLEQMATCGTEDSQKQALSAFEKETDGLLLELESYMAEAQP